MNVKVSKEEKCGCNGNERFNYGQIHKRNRAE